MCILQLIKMCVCVCEFTHGTRSRRSREWKKRKIQVNQSHINNIGGLILHNENEKHVKIAFTVENDYQWEPNTDENSWQIFSKYQIHTQKEIKRFSGSHGSAGFFQSVALHKHILALALKETRPSPASRSSYFSGQLWGSVLKASWKETPLYSLEILWFAEEQDWATRQGSKSLLKDNAYDMRRGG